MTLPNFKKQNTKMSNRINSTIPQQPILNMKVWDQKPAKHVLGNREGVDEHGDPSMLEATRVANRQDVGLLWENGDDGLNGAPGRVDLQPGVQEVQ
jgi:hypothetical protein